MSAECRGEPPGAPCGTSALCGSGICDEFERCVDRPLCAGAGASDVRYLLIGLVVVVAVVVAVLGIALPLALLLRDRKKR